MTKNLISVVSLIVISTILPTFIHCQNTSIFEDYLEGPVPDVRDKDSAPQKFLMTTDYLDYDLYGNFKRKNRVSGEITILEDGNKKWNDIKTYHAQNLNESYPEGERRIYMEDFTYGPSSDILDESFFESVPEADIYMKNLIWDMTGFEIFAWYKWDSLQLNSICTAKEINAEINMPGAGTFENKDILITWTGITKTNNKICRIIKFNAMNNPLELSHPNSTIKGRSHYWGNIYVSISDKQIEYADLYEDVILDIKMNGQKTGVIANTVRTITLQKTDK